MFCGKCGAQLNDGERYCHFCGTLVQSEGTIVPAPDAAQTPVYPKVETVNGTVLKKGILGLAFAESFFLSFLGIIFSAMALSEFKRLNGPVGSKARVGRGLAIGGLISGIIVTIFFIIWLFAIIFAFSSSHIYYY